MKKAATLAAVIVAILSTGALGATRMYANTDKFEGKYLCRPSAAGGIAWSTKSKKWVGTAFRIRDDESMLLTLKAKGVQMEKNGMGEDEDAMVYGVEVMEIPTGGTSTCWSDGSDNVFIGNADENFSCNLIYTTSG
ncbi:hypothetical protein FKO01_04090 [Mesorhizobium sp. B2-3-3]|nr:hypothetical protein FKO01_04090 [Mesorhizobium sp. B2-3-3]